ncbi:hypothetical protein [Kitasatospora sp. NPDC059827]|uniref:hypothetical protein n=1 Tax=Kitasatospora sp. NPDC059827 TaxID=3346964 RepID=UPI0036637EA7
MTWYLAIRSDSRYGESIPTSALTEYLDSIPELCRTDLSGYTAEGGLLGWVHLVIASCGPTGSYATHPSRLPQDINLVQLICSSSLGSNYEAQEALARRIAVRLDWEMLDDETDEILHARVQPTG